MILNPTEVEQLLHILDRQFLFFVGSHMGPEFLSVNDKKVLNSLGVNPDKIYSLSQDPSFTNFQLGMLSKVLGDPIAKNMDFVTLKNHIEMGRYIPLNAREKRTLQSVKYQSLNDIRAIKGRIFNDVNGIVSQENLNQRTNQEEFIRDEIKQGLANRASIRDITRGIARKTGDWSRDFQKMVQYVSHAALNEGRAAIVQRKFDRPDQAKVYFQVQPGACKHCIHHYLTGGFGSEPKVFSLEQLQANASNIGRKVAEWLPTIHPLHPHCRCLLTEWSEGTKWDGEKWADDEKYVSTIDRPKVRVVFDGKEYFV